MLLPDLRLGAVWRGLVYPIRDNNCIDTDGEAFAPATCKDGTEVAHPSAGFASIQGADEAYLLLAGPVTVREEAASNLLAAGIAVLRVGRYLGDPIDGFAADWFVRFEKPASNEPLDELLARVLGRRRSQLQTEAEPALEARIRLLHDELARARGREASLRAELATASAAAKPATDADTVETLLGELAEERRLRHEAEAAKALAEAALEVAHKERAQALLPTPGHSLPRARLRDEISDVAASLLPHLNLLRDSLTVAASEYVSRKALYRCLAELASVESRLPPNWKSVQGVAGWWERHVSDGQANTGRIYALYIGEARRWDVLISDKAEQPRDMAWLRRRPPASR
jgi:hypothetical protein